MPTFRFPRLTRADLPLLQRWLATPHVAEWWGRAPTLADVEKEYGEYIDGREPIHPHLVVCDGIAIGHAQWMQYGDYAWYARLLGIDDPRTANCDVLIGEVDWVHRGIGPHMVARYVDDVVFADSSVSTCTIDPDARNTIAIRAYERAGFRFVRDVKDDGEGNAIRLMEKQRLERV